MSTPASPDLGSIVTNGLARKTIYSAYVIALVVAGACQVAFATPGLGEQPLWLSVSLNVLAYLGIPVGGLAIANTVTAAQAARHAKVDGSYDVTDLPPIPLADGKNPTPPVL